MLPAAGGRTLQGLEGDVGTGVSAAWRGVCLWLAWSGNSVLKEAGRNEKTLRDCSAVS